MVSDPGALYQNATPKFNDGSVFIIGIAGGRGHHLDELSKAFPDVPGRLILQNLPRVIDDITDLNPRIERKGLYMFEAQPVQGVLFSSNLFR